MTGQPAHAPHSNIEVAQAPQGRGFDGYALAVVSVIIYAFSIKYVLSHYAAPFWPIFSFVYDPPTAHGYAITFVSLAVTAAFAPRTFDRPSYLILSFSYYFVIVPLIVAAACMEIYSPHSYFPLSLFASACFSAICVANDRLIAAEAPLKPIRVATAGLPVLLISGFFVLAVFLYVRFGEVLTLVGLDSLYEQRSRGAATTLVDGYAQTYSQYVFSTGLVAYGCFRRNILFVIAGFGGALLNFSITAEKAGFLFPFFVAALYILLGRKMRLLKSTNIFPLGFAALNFISTYLFTQNTLFEIITINFGVRTTLVPGVFTLHYLDFFTERGFTLLSHIRGINLFVDAPAAYTGDARWPSIGVILGEDYIGYSELNANANFVAFDGVASLGTWGIIVPFATLLIVIRLFDKVCEGIPIRLSLPLLAPFALTLSNASVFTDLASFGGLFWMFVFATMFTSAVEKPAASPTGAARGLV